MFILDAVLDSNMGKTQPTTGKPDSGTTPQPCYCCDELFPEHELTVWVHSENKPKICPECIMILTGGLSHSW